MRQMHLTRHAIARAQALHCDQCDYTLPCGFDCAHMNNCNGLECVLMPDVCVTCAPMLVCNLHPQCHSARRPRFKQHAPPQMYNYVLPDTVHDYYAAECRRHSPPPRASSRPTLLRRHRQQRRQPTALPPVAFDVSMAVSLDALPPPARRRAARALARRRSGQRRGRRRGNHRANVVSLLGSRRGGGRPHDRA